jgi:hypothetical protein
MGSICDYPIFNTEIGLSTGEGRDNILLVYADRRARLYLGRENTNFGYLFDMKGLVAQGRWIL